MLSKLPEVTQQVTVSGFFWDPVHSGNSTQFSALGNCFQAQLLHKAPRALFSKEK